jgi:hypothetical protein
MKNEFNDSAEALFFSVGHNNLAQVKAQHAQGIDLTMGQGRALQIAVLAQYPQMVALLLDLSFKQGSQHYIAQAAHTAVKIKNNSPEILEMLVQAYPETASSLKMAENFAAPKLK